MRRLKRNKRGFTLTEIILVIAIIVILTAALAAGIAIDLNRYKQYLANLNTSGGGNWEGDARGRVAGMFGTLDPAPEYNGEPTPLPTADATEEAEETEVAENTEVPAPPTEKAGDPTDAPPTQGPTQAPPTVKPADPTQAPSGGGGVSVGNVSAPNTVTSGKGVYSIEGSSSSPTVKVGNDQWNTATFTITGNPGNYTLTFTNEGNRYIVDQNVFKDLWKNQPYKLNSEQINYLKNTYGVTLK